MRLHLHIELLTVDRQLSDRPELIEAEVRDELTRVLAAQGLPVQRTVCRNVPSVGPPVLHLARAGGLTGQQIAGCIHAGLLGNDSAQRDWSVRPT